MRHSLSTVLLIGGLAVLLAVLGVLQYRWLKQISESDGEKARQHVRDQTERFAMDFNREIQNAYFNFQTGAEVFREKDWRPFNERYEYWRSNSAYPGLITAFYFVGPGPALKYDFASKTFIEADEGTEIDVIRARLAEEANFRPVDAESLTLFLPIHDMQHRVEGTRVMLRTPMPGSIPPPNAPPRYGYLAIKLDPATVKDGILADLDSKYFGNRDYSIAVTNDAGDAVYRTPADSPDVSASLFDLSPDNIIFYANKDLMKSIGGEKQMDVRVDQRTGNHSTTRVETVTGQRPANGVMKFEVKREAKPRTSVFTATTRGDAAGPWTLSVQHATGPLDDYVASTLRRNLIGGFGILFLLAAAIAAIIISSMRVRRFAQRQLDFVSSISHEFRTPLAVIYSAGENLADGVAKDDSQVSKYGHLIKGEGRKLTAMVEQILDFAGARSGKRKFSLGPTNIADVVDAAIDECRPMLDDRGIDVETAVAGDLPSISGDHAALSQALQNLIANSIKYSDVNRWLRVTAANGDGKVKISVEDRGIGISKSDLRQIFEPFYRSKQVVDAQIHGNGLGLSLVKQIITAHGGTVSAESEVGKGSRFTIELPQS